MPRTPRAAFQVGGAWWLTDSHARNLLALIGWPLDGARPVHRIHPSPGVQPQCRAIAWHAMARWVENSHPSGPCPNPPQTRPLRCRWKSPGVEAAGSGPGPAEADPTGFHRGGPAVRARLGLNASPIRRPGPFSTCTGPARPVPTNRREEGAALAVPLCLQPLSGCAPSRPPSPVRRTSGRASEDEPD